MGDAGFFKGTSADQDSRFSNKEKKLLKTMSFPPEFEQKVNMKKVNLDVIRPWISNRITELLGFEDEVVVDYASSLLEEEDLDPKRMQINLTGFLESKTKIFIKELWNLLLSAQNSVGGIPAEFIEQKKEELRKQQEEEEKRRAHRQSVMDTIRKKQAAEMEDLRKEEERRRPYYVQYIGSSFFEWTIGEGKEIADHQCVVEDMKDRILDHDLARVTHVHVLATEKDTAVAGTIVIGMTIIMSAAEVAVVEEEEAAISMMVTMTSTEREEDLVQASTFSYSARIRCIYRGKGKK
ncbi:PWI domain-containing protein [Mycotypha africana]|uniref:PWI domain-containing protein n=1 Tax=Mycotypha africana TaxID=64632 RepID=UPI002301E4D8|nr:PWI domain-containing protein [Mycotypha africana]KAI8979145.1 PWI domain-containing protein [Mycotypha africana]